MKAKRLDLFHRMRDLNIRNSRIDMHMHTTWTDGKDSLENMVVQAEKNGLTEIAITDHIRKSSEYYPGYICAINGICETSHINISIGFEAKVMNKQGDVDILDEAANAADFVIASVHRLPYGDCYKLPRDIPYEELINIERDLALAVISKRHNITVLGHCGGMSIVAYKSFPLEYFEEVIKECAKMDVVFEYNYKYHYGFESEIKDMLYKYNPYVSVGSDAHEIGKIADRSFL